MYWRKLKPWCVPCKYHDSSTREITEVTEYKISQGLKDLAVKDCNTMVGNNKLFINQAEMNAAVQYYLNQVILKEPCKVVGVDSIQRSGDSGFEIKIMPLETIPLPTVQQLMDTAKANGTLRSK